MKRFFETISLIVITCASIAASVYMWRAVIRFFAHCP